VSSGCLPCLRLLSLVVVVRWYPAWLGLFFGVFSAARVLVLGVVVFLLFLYLALFRLLLLCTLFLVFVAASVLLCFWVVFVWL